MDMEAADETGKSSLPSAAGEGHLEVVRYLVEQGANMEAVDSLLLTPLGRAILWGHLEVAQCLVQQGSTTGTSNGRSVLHLAASLGHLKIVENLLDHGADRDIHDAWGRTPLHSAAVAGHLEIVQCLMSYGVDINAKNNEGQTPIDIARTEEIKQAIRDVEQQRYAANFGKKRIPEADLRPPAPPSKEAKVGEEEDEDEEEDESSSDDDDDDDDDKVVDGEK